MKNWRKRIKARMKGIKAFGHSYGRSGSKYRSKKTVYWKPHKKKYQFGYK